MAVKFLFERFVLVIAHVADRIREGRMYACVSVSPAAITPPAPEDKPEDEADDQEEEKAPEEKERQRVEGYARQDAHCYRSQYVPFHNLVDTVSRLTHR